MKRKTMQWLALLSAASLSMAAVAGGKGGGAAGGMHMSESGKANTNGRFAEERKFGQDRAAARRSAQGAAHEKGSAASAGAKGPNAGGAVAVETPTAPMAPAK